MQDAKIRQNENSSIPQSAIDNVVSQIAARFQPEKIILFGSYAHGNPHPESDVDILVMMETPLRNIEQAIEISRAINCPFGLDLIVRRPQQIAERLRLGDFFLRDIMKKGKVLYERSDQRVDR